MALRPEFKEPTGSLLTELMELSSVAEECRQAFDDANFMPDDFPSESVRSILLSLEQLHLGSARGCQGPLEYARSRLPTIRRDYFLIEKDAEEFSASLDRGSYLDRCLKDTIASVATALDEYRNYYTSASNDEIDFKDSTYVLEHNDGKKLLSESSNLDNYIGSKIRENDSFSEIADSRKAGRLLHDIENVNLTVFADIGYGRIVIRWTRRLISQIRRYPSMIRFVAKSARNAVVTSEPLRVRWRDFWSDLEDFGAQQIIKTANALENTADKIESRRRNPTSGEVEDIKPATDDISQWIENFILERTQDHPLISFSYIASAIQYHFNSKPKDVAIKSGFKKLFDTVLKNSNLDAIKKNKNIYVFHASRRNSVIKLIKENNNKYVTDLEDMIETIKNSDNPNINSSQINKVKAKIVSSIYIPYHLSLNNRTMHNEFFFDLIHTFTDHGGRLLDRHLIPEPNEPPDSTTRGLLD